MFVSMIAVAGPVGLWATRRRCHQIHRLWRRPVVADEAAAMIDAGEADRAVPDVPAIRRDRPQTDRLAAQGLAEEDEVLMLAA
jgi:hypothetical protein